MQGPPQRCRARPRAGSWPARATGRLPPGPGGDGGAEAAGWPGLSLSKGWSPTPGPSCPSRWSSDKKVGLRHLRGVSEGRACSRRGSPHGNTPPSLRRPALVLRHSAHLPPSSPLHLPLPFAQHLKRHVPASHSSRPSWCCVVFTPGPLCMSVPPPQPQSRPQAERCLRTLRGARAAAGWVEWTRRPGCWTLDVDPACPWCVSGSHLL